MVGLDVKLQKWPAYEEALCYIGTPILSIDVLRMLGMYPFENSISIPAPRCFAV